MLKCFCMSILLDNFRIDKKILQRILDFLPYPFLVAEFRNGTHTNIYVNQKFREEIGYTIADIPTIDDWFEKAYPDPTYRNEVMKSWGMLYQLAQRQRDDFVIMKASIRTNSRGDRWYEVKSSIFGRVQLVAFIDIHEVMLKKKELRRLNENKNKTLSILSHDLRGPIANLHELSKLALGHNLAQDEFFALVRNVNEKTFQTLEFLDTTLLWTRSNFDSIQITNEQIDLKGIVWDILAIYNDSFHDKKITVTQALSKDLKISCDPSILTIVTRNLISNAIKFTPEGVTDTGIGMTPDVVTEILSDNYTSRRGTRQEKVTETPYKPSEEFQIQVDFQFKQRNNTSANTVEFVETDVQRAKNQSSTGLRPYLILNLKFLKLSDQEVKVKAVNNVHHVLFNKKIKLEDTYKIDMGFTDDVKGRVTPHEVNIVLSSNDKKETSRIRLFIKDDGTFVVNGEARGKF
ncbi:hypothetical protein FGG08_007428 [Glutinoglossum americanum]|uniref:histidine kinase n=1 Tax=Glutinoglossum americanum TaxID=1670608 RepID=A0A9P8HYV0_9PEZI|nr:hypothetical protein FGG08_007428 [Glutinoglossum americanum]